MRAVLLLLFVATLAFGVEKKTLREAFRQVAFVAKASQVARQLNLKDMSVTCALCGVATNEVLGLLLENRTQSDIENALKTGLCGLFPAGLTGVCDDFVGLLPEAIALIERGYTPSGVCTEIKLCDRPFLKHQDPFPTRTFTINLDKAPIDRFTEVCSVPFFKENAQFLVGAIGNLFGQETLEALTAAGTFLNDVYFPTEYADEIRGCARAFGINAGALAFMNLGYEISDACTSIVAAAPDGTVVHARNLDFWSGMGFTDTLKNMSYTALWQKGNQTIYKTGQIAGYVGVLSGQKTGKFSITVNTRFYAGSILNMFDEILQGFEHPDASLVTFLVRDVLRDQNNYAGAVQQLSNSRLIADVYYTVAGTSAARNEGATIARNRTAARYTWALDVAHGVWYTGVANYDRVGPNSQPWYDDRWDPAMSYMEKVGKAGVSVDSLFTNVMSVKPVLNLQSTYTTMSVPATSYWTTHTRWCPYPCVQ